ncbi:MAG: hypothetical protein Q9187_002477 [Circinaria calcarea]
MIRDTILKAKRDELANCITSRKRKLQELYHATVSLAGSEPLLQRNEYNAVGHNNNGEAAFLEANNILEGRFFDPSTLRLLADLQPGSHDGSSALSVTKTTPHEDLENSVNLKQATDNGTESSAGSQRLSIGASALLDSIHQHRSHSQAGEHVGSPKTLSKATQAGFAAARTNTPTVDDQIPDDVASRSLLQTQTWDQDSSKSRLPSSSKDLIRLEARSEIITPEIASTTISDTPMFNGAISPVERNGYNLVSKRPPDKPPEPHLQDFDQTSDRNSEGSLRGATVIEESQPGQALGHTSFGPVTEASAQTDMTITRQGREMDIGSLGHVKDTCTEEKYLQNEKRIGNPSHDGFRGTKFSGAQVFAATPSTPDAQLRLEEAQSLNSTNTLLPTHAQDYHVTDNHILPDGDTTVASKISEVNVDIADETTGIPVTEHSVGLDHVQGSRRTPERNRSSDNQNLSPPDRRLPGMTRDMSKDLMFSQRPPMRIDTHYSTPSTLHESKIKTPNQAPGDLYSPYATSTPSTLHESKIKAPNQALGDLYSPYATSTPVKVTPLPVNSSPPERMTTRVSSGALRHKSVSEILGETPKPSIQSGDRTPIDKGGQNLRKEESGSQTPGYGHLVTSPDSVNFRSRLSELREREKERSKLSTVVFARQQPTEATRTIDAALGRHTDPHASTDEPKDYLISLFTAQATSQSPGLNALLGSAHKTLTTSNHYLDFHEQQDKGILKRIYHLQNSNRWSLRQLERSIEPQRPASCWDTLLGEMKWMRTDFREERKWKITAAKNLVDWCAEWVASPADRRVFLQVRTTGPARSTQTGLELPSMDGIEMSSQPDNKGESLLSESTPDLIPSAGDDSSDAMDEDLPHIDFTRVDAPAAIFSLAPEDVLFGIGKTPTSERLLSELPLYEPWREPQNTVRNPLQDKADQWWKTPIVPISKFAIGKMIIREEGPARKKSRFDYADADTTEEVMSSRLFLAPDQTSDPIAPEQEDVALFNPENKHIRDRIHAGHAFRPPSEHNMPNQSFFECRQSSQWTYTEDDELRRLVREYAYNWSLISSCLSSPSLFSSGAERRTPWECFERWVGLEGLPAEMSKTQYFRTYHARLENAQLTLNAQYQAALQQQGNNAQLPIRRKNTQPVRVDRRRNNKHLALVHAMQKLAKKQETTAQKQQHVASLAALRKANEAAQPRQRMKTPQEFSHFKHERECKMQEKADLYKQQVIAQQRVIFLLQLLYAIVLISRKAAMAQRASQHMGQQQTGSALPQPGRNPASAIMNGTSPHLTSSLPNNHIPPSHPNQNRLPPPPHPAVNGMPMNVPQVHNGQLGPRGSGIPQAQMQPHMQGQQRMQQQAGSDMRVYIEANRLQHEQQQYLQQQQQQQQQRRQQQSQANGQNASSTSPGAGTVNVLSQSNPSAMIASLQATNGIPSPAINGVSGPPGPSTSPLLENSMQAQPLSSGMVPAVNQISNSIKARHPQASPEQVNRMTTETLQYRMVQSQSQAAMLAAAGSNTSHHAANLQLPPQQQAMVNGPNGAPSISPQIYAQMMRNQQSHQQSRSGGNGMNGARPPSRGGTPQMHRSSSSVQVGASQSPRPPQAQMAGAQ